MFAIVKHEQRLPPLERFCYCAQQVSAAAAGDRQGGGKDKQRLVIIGKGSKAQPHDTIAKAGMQIRRNSGRQPRLAASTRTTDREQTGGGE